MLESPELILGAATLFVRAPAKVLVLNIMTRNVNRRHVGAIQTT